MNEPVTLPAAGSSYLVGEAAFIRDELPAILARYFAQSWVYSGGLHGTAAGKTSAAFATEAFTEVGHRVTANGAGGMVAIPYGTMGAADNDTCWVIISTQDPSPIVGTNFSRVGTSHYFVDVVSSSQPALPTVSVWLMKVTISGGAITRVDDLRNRSPLPFTSFFGMVNVQAFGAVGDGTTDDTVALTAAISYASANSLPLYFPAHTYLTTATLPSLHTVKKVGAGVIKRGSDLFYVEPTNAQSNVLYVATTGNNANDGLTSSQPVATLAQACTILKSYGPALNGAWTIALAAGTYSQGTIDFPVILGNLNRVVIQGVVVNHPNVPTTIFDGSSSLAYGLNFNSRAYVTVSNIKFQNYTTYGVVGQDLGDIICTNVHVASVSGGPGIKLQQGRLRVQGGILTSCQIGVECIGGTTFTIGDPAGASLANGTQMLSCTQAGILAQEQSSGHADYCTIDNCAVGLEIVIHSRVHAAHCSIINNATAAVRCRQASDWFDNGTFAGFSGNTNNELIYSWGGQVGRDGSRTSELRQAMDQTLITTTGVFAAAVVKTYSDAIAADTFNNPTKAFRVKIYGTLTGTAGSKNITVNLAGSPAFGFTVAAAVEGDYVIDGIVYAFGASGAQQSFVGSMLVEGQTVKVQQGSRSITMVTGSNIAMTILNTINGAGDTIVIRGVDQYCIGAC